MSIHPATPTTLYDAYIFDLDGTVYLGDALLPTAGETISTLRDLGNPARFAHARRRCHQLFGGNGRFPAPEPARGRPVCNR